jgi:hypothetical protein
MLLHRRRGYAATAMPAGGRGLSWLEAMADPWRFGLERTEHFAYSLLGTWGK